MADKKPSQVLRWVSMHLAGVFPDWFKSMFFGEPAVVEARLDKNATKILRKNRQLIVPLSLLHKDSPEIPAVQSRVVDIKLPKSFFLKRIVEAPITARKNLGKMVELDMVRRTPFRQDTVYWAIGGPSKSGNVLKVEQWIAKRTEIAQLHQRAEKLGLKIRRVFVDGVPLSGPVVDLSASVIPNAKRWRILNGALAMCALLLGAAIWLFPAWQASVENKRLQAALDENRTQAIQLRQEVETLRSQEIERAKLLDIVYNRPRLSNVLRNLTVVLPDNVWITDLNFSPSQLVVSGEVSGSAAELVLALGQRNEFNNPRLSGPVSRAGNGAERFELTLDLAGAK